MNQLERNLHDLPWFIFHLEQGWENRSLELVARAESFGACELLPMAVPWHWLAKRPLALSWTGDHGESEPVRICQRSKQQPTGSTTQVGRPGLAWF